MFYLFLRHDAFSFELSADELSTELFFLVLFRARKYLFMANAVRPPVDAVPTATIAAVAIQNGHMCASFCYRDDCLLPYPSSGANGFGLLADAIQYSVPSRESSRLCAHRKRIQVLCGGTVISVPPSFSLRRYCKLLSDRRRHEERPGKFEQRWALDGLHGCPEMAVAVAQVAIPTAARPRLDLHGQRLAVVRFVSRPDLFEQAPQRSTSSVARTWISWFKASVKFSIPGAVNVIVSSFFRCRDAAYFFISFSARSLTRVN